MQPLVCSHYWIDPDEPAIHRARYSPIIGPGRREMKAGKTYGCLNCGQKLDIQTVKSWIFKDDDTH
jgi:hypothetical protein